MNGARVNERPLVEFMVQSRRSTSGLAQLGLLIAQEKA